MDGRREPSTLFSSGDFQKHGFVVFLWRFQVLVALSIVCVTIFGLIVTTYYALHTIRPASFKFTAKLTKLVSIEMEVQSGGDPCGRGVATPTNRAPLASKADP
jgi:type III secretory pathway component EscS